MRVWMLTLVGLLGFPLASWAAAGPTGQSIPRLFQPPRRPILPTVRDVAWGSNPIDRFLLARLEARGLAPSRPADRLRLLRRVTFDLIGLPPTIEEQEAFVNDPSPDAYRKVVERLLHNPRFGERWAQHWLDLVRYAETDGFKEDALRPEVHRYRDWVIRAFNANLPYDQFIRLQLAGDELEPGNPDALIATGFNRLWPDESNAANLEQRRQEILDDTTDTAGLVFLGLTMGCARCHDHKFDPISQKDYFRLQAFFAPMQPRELPAVDLATLRAHHQRRAAWEKATAGVRAEMEQIIGKKELAARDTTLLRFNTDIQNAVRTPTDRRTPYQRQIALMAQKQLDRAAQAVVSKLPPEEKKRYQELEKKLAAFGPAPPPIPLAMAVTDIGPVAPPTHRLVGGDWRKPATELKPGFPSILGNATPDTRLPAGVVSTGRRAALARWLTDPNHPLTARVMVNRLWQHHFGVGIVATPSDFGAQGTPPTHPELLDWLAVECVESGYDMRHMHRLMVLSSAYCQDSAVDTQEPHQARALVVDRDNALLWRTRRRRLEGEAIRDSVLSLSGALNGRMFGPSARPALPASFGKAAWKPDARIEEQHRRSIYVLAKRNLRFPLFDAFDLPDLHNSCARRLCTITAPQALLLLNGELTLTQARQWAMNLRGEHGENVERFLAGAYRAAWGRPASADELRLGQRFVAAQAARYRDEGTAEEPARTAAFVDFCHALLNTNEFVTID